MKRLIVLLLLVFAVALPALPTMGRDTKGDIIDMEDFVARGYAGELTNEQIDQYTADWTEEDWIQFYATLATVSGMDNPEAVAADIIAEDKALAGNDASPPSQYSAEIPRTHNFDPSMRSAHYWQTAQYGCDDDADVDYQYMFYVSAANVLNMKWYSTNGWIGIIVGSVSGKLKAFGSVSTILCIGDTCICVVGGIYGCATGADWAHDALRLKP